MSQESDEVKMGIVFLGGLILFSLFGCAMVADPAGRELLSKLEKERVREARVLQERKVASNQHLDKPYGVKDSTNTYMKMDSKSVEYYFNNK